MAASKIKLNRNHGYDVLINTFESSLRQVMIDTFSAKYGKNWIDQIPKGVFNELSDFKDYDAPSDCSIEEFFEELSFSHLKDILIYKTNFKTLKPFFGDLSKDKFRDLMDELNVIRRKIAHAKSTFTEFDLLVLKDKVRMLSLGEEGKDIRLYLEIEGYRNAKDVPNDFFREYEVQNNLPPENYDMDGGFVGRAKEIRTIMRYIKSKEDRVITITGAGGVGKTAIALKIGYHLISESPSTFDAIIWFSAKSSRLTEKGIVPEEPGIKSHEQLIHSILTILDPETHKTFEDSKVPLNSYVNYIYSLFKSHQCLFIVDNLETIIGDRLLIDFITNIPRPSQLLITSRKGLGEFERRYPLGDMAVDDAETLFRIIAKERNRPDLVRLNKDTIRTLVTTVKCYPLLIKWSIGQVCLGKEIDAAFSQIFAGESAIAEFSFNDVFAMLSDNSKLVLFSMIVYGDKPVSKTFLMHLSNLNEEEFEDAIKELILTSFVFPEISDNQEGTATGYCMLELTRGFITTQLDSEKKIREMLQTRHYHLSQEIKDIEQSRTSYYQSYVSLGIRTTEEQVAFFRVKAAKNFFYQDNNVEAEKNFKLALKAAPKNSYVLTEYSKYKFKTNQKIVALQIAKQAVTYNQENYHSWFNYGIMLKKMNDIRSAISCFIKAKELNPSHLPIYTELGRAYTFDRKYDLAEKEFTSALKEEKYPNYRHKAITLSFLADNYRRWAESFTARRDYIGAIEKLERAKETILNALYDSPRDGKLYDRLFQIYIDLAIVLHQNYGFEQANPYLEQCIKPVYFGNYKIRVFKEIIAKAYFYLAAFGIAEKEKNIKEIEDLISQGKALTKDHVLAEKFDDLIEQISNNREERLQGTIKMFNTFRKFGIIESDDETYLFFLPNFRERLELITIYNLAGKNVSFTLMKNPVKSNSWVADDIVLEN